MIVYNCLIRSAHHFWHISRENYKIIMVLLFQVGASPVIYTYLPTQRQALRVSPADLVDVLPPAYNFGPSSDFSILYLRLLWNGKIILAINIFRSELSIYSKGLVK